MLTRRQLPLLCVLVTVCVVYGNFFNNAFHFDDFHTVTDNPAVRSLHALPRIFTDTTAFSVLPANQTYRPVVTASLALDYALGHGYVPFWFHLSTLLWFLVLVAVLYGWAETIYERVQPAGTTHRWLALGVAAWFGLHPAMAETVNYVIQRGDLYCTLGCVGALLLYARSRLSRRFGLYLLPFVAAMLSKPPASVFPLLLLMYVWFFDTAGLQGWPRFLRAARACVPALMVTVSLLVFQARMTPKSYAPSIVPAAAYRLVQPYVWLRYAGALWLPLHLNVDTDLQPTYRWTGAVVAGVVFALGVLVAALVCARRQRLFPIAYGLLWFLLTQLPTSAYTLSEVENDHRMFFSFPGLMLACVWALFLGYDAIRRRVRSTRGRMWLQRAAMGASALALCGYAYGAHVRNAVWHDEASLWADDVRKSPANGRGLMIYGLTRMNAGDYPEALEYFNRALRYTPNYPTLEINLGVVNGLMADAGEIQRVTEAEAHFARAIQLAPADDLPHAYYGRWLLTHGRAAEAMRELEIAVSLNAQRPMQRDLLLTAYAEQGNTRAAQALALSTLAVVPGDSEAQAVLNGAVQPQSPQTAAAVALINASLASYRAGLYQQSIDQAQAALRLNPRAAEAWNNIGAGFGALHRWDEGMAAEEHALALDPALQIARNNLQWFQAQKVAEGGNGSGASAPERAASATEYVNASLALNQAGKYEESIQAARHAVALDPRSAEAWNNIAAGEEAMHRWDEAIDAARHAVALRPDFQLARNNLLWSMQQKAQAAQH